MIFFEADAASFDLEEEDEEEGAIDDALLGELDDEDLDDLDEDFDPLMKEDAFEDLENELSEDHVKEDGGFEDEEEDEEDMDYDSFDDEDEM